MQLREQLTNLQETTLHRALAVPVKKPKRLKTNQSRKQTRGFYKTFDKTLLIINDTPSSYVIKTADYGTINISKGFCVKDGLWISHIDTWYLREHCPILKKLHV